VLFIFQAQVQVLIRLQNLGYSKPIMPSIRRCQDTSDPRHFGTSAEVSVRHFGTSAELSGHFGTSAEVSFGHFGTKEDTSAPRYIHWMANRTTAMTRLILVKIIVI